MVTHCGDLSRGNETMARSSEGLAVTEQRRTMDRRIRGERRSATPQAYSGEERRVAPERRVKVERRRQIDPTTCERDYQTDEIEFMRAMDEYKRRSGRMFPTWSEVLEVVKSLGYQRVGGQPHASQSELRPTA